VQQHLTAEHVTSQLLPLFTPSVTFTSQRRRCGTTGSPSYHCYHVMISASTDRHNYKRLRCRDILSTAVQLYDMKL